MNEVAAAPVLAELLGEVPIGSVVMLKTTQTLNTTWRREDVLGLIGLVQEVSSMNGPVVLLLYPSDSAAGETYWESSERMLKHFEVLELGDGTPW